jgi:Holliday junction resolvase
MNTQKPPLETKVVAKIMVYLKSRGGFWIKIHGSPFQIAGIPDILGCYRGLFVAFEVKRDATGRPTKLQAFQMGKIKAAGGIATLIYTVEQAVAELDRIDEISEA